MTLWIMGWGGRGEDIPEKTKGALQGVTKDTQNRHKGSTGYTGWMMVGQVEAGRVVVGG